MESSVKSGGFFRWAIAAALCALLLVGTAIAVRADRSAAKIALKNGNDRFFERDWAAAEADFTLAVSEDPDWAVPYNNRGLARYKRERLSEAEADFSAAIERDAAYPAPLINRAKCRAAQKRWSDAHGDLNAGLDLSPEHPKLLYNLAWILDARGDPAQAAEIYETLLSLNPEHLRGRIGLAVAYAKMERTNDAAAMFYEALNQAEPGDLSALLAAYNLQLLRGPGLSFADDEAASNYLEGVFLLSAGQHTRCRSALNDSLASDRRVADVYWIRYLSYLTDGLTNLAHISRRQSETLRRRFHVEDFDGGADVYLDGRKQGAAPLMLFLFNGPSDLVLRRLADGRRLAREVPLPAGPFSDTLTAMQVNPVENAAFNPLNPIPDTDGDQLADAWEIRWFGDLSPAPTDDLPDEDTLPNLREFQAGTDPDADDTDADGLSDAREAAGGTTDPARANTFYYINDLSTANDVYCSAPGDDANDGRSPETPKASLTALLDAVDLAPGAVVRVDHGTYLLNADIWITDADDGSALQPVLFQGAPDAGTVFDRNSTAAGAGALRLTGTAHVVITDIVFTGAVNGFGLAMETGAAGTVRRCTARGNRIGFRINGRLENCLAFENDTGIEAGASADICNCTTANNRLAGIATRGAWIQNCIIAASGESAFGIYHQDGSIRSDDNNLYAADGAAVGFYRGRRESLAAWRKATGQDGWSIGSDPGFANALQHDFHLRSTGGRFDPDTGARVADAATSPAVDAGSLDANAAREPDPGGGRVNLGAFGNTAEAAKSGLERRLTLLAPLGGESFNQTVPIRFLSSGTGWAASDTLMVEYAVGTAPETWHPIATGIPADLSAFLWEIPDAVAGAGQAFFVRLRCEQAPDVIAAASQPFHLHRLQLTAPAAGAHVAGGTVVQWDTAGAGWTPHDTLRLEVSADGGRTWTPAAEHLPALNGVWTWDASAAASGPHYLLRLISEQHPNLQDESDAPFYVRNTPLIYFVNDSATGLDAWCTAAGRDDAGYGAAPDRPAATLTWLLESFDLEPGDTVHIDTGSYVLDADIVVSPEDGGAENQPVRFVGSPFGVVLDRGDINPGRAVFRLDYAAHIDLTTGFSDRHPDAARRWMALTGGHLGIDMVVVYHCTLSRLNIYGNARAGIASNSGLGLVCRNNVIHDNGCGIYLIGCHTNTLENNTICNNTENQIDLEQYSVVTRIRNNIIAAGGEGAKGIRVHNLARDLKLCDYNLIHTADGAVTGHFGGECATLQAWQTATGQGAHSLSTAPGFVDPENADFHLTSTGGRYRGGRWKADSATGAGVDTGDPAADIGDETVDHGGRINLGAYGGTEQASRTPPGRSIVLVAPNGGETVRGVYTVRWLLQGREWSPADTLRIETAVEDGPWETAAETVPAVEGAYAWNTAALPSGASYRLRLTVDDAAETTAVSERWFAVANTRIIYYVNDASTANDVWCTAPGEDAPQRGTNPASPAASVSWILGTYDLEPGDTVQIDTGDYTLSENIHITAPDQGSATAPTVFEASPYGVTLDRGDRSGGHFVWWIDRAAHIVIRTAAADRYPDRPQSWMQLENTHIGVNMEYAEDCTAEKITAESCGNVGVNLFRSTGCTVRNCLIFGADGCGIQVWDTAESVVENNTLASNDDGGLCLSGSTTAARLRNNIISQSGARKAAVYSTSRETLSASDYNMIQTAAGAVCGVFGINEYCTTLRDWQRKSSMDIHSIAIDPGFADPAAGDYHLLSTGGRYTDGTWIEDARSSPAVDAGDPADAVGAEPHANGGRINMGAYGASALASRSPAGRLISVRMPRGREIVAGTYPIAWLSPGQAWNAEDTVTIAYSADDGATWHTIAAGVAARAAAGDMAFKWNTTALSDGPFYRVRITCDQAAGVRDESTSWFTVRNAPISYYVNDDDNSGDVWCTATGSAGHDGLTPETPLSSVQSVLDRYDLEPGDTVFIDTGVYTLMDAIHITNADEGSADAPVTFKASAGGVVFDRGGAKTGWTAWFVDDADSVAITTDTESAAHAAPVYMKIINSGSGVLFRNAENGTAAFLEITASLVGIDSYSSDDLEIHHNLIHGNQSGLSFNGSADNWITHNTVVDNTVYQFDSWSEGRAVVANNIFRADGAGSAVFRKQYGTPILASDYNLFDVRNGALLAVFNGDIATIDAWRNATGFDAHSLSGPPVFVDAESGDYHLQSPCGSYHGGAWTADAEASPALDRADPAAEWHLEPLENGARANLGAYGATPQASRSIFSFTPPARYTPMDSVALHGSRISGVTVSVTADTAATAETVVYSSENSWETLIRGLVEGANTLTVSAADGTGLSTAAKVVIVYDSTPPEVTVDQTAYATRTGSQTINGSRESNAQIAAAAESTETEVEIICPDETTWQAVISGLTPGVHPITVTASDAAGNTASISVAVNYDPFPPRVELDPVTTPTVSPEQILSGKREAESLISLTADTNAVIEPAAYPSPDTWTARISGLAEGPNRLTVTATDDAGNIAEVTGTILYGTHFYCSGDMDQNDTVDLADAIGTLKICVGGAPNTEIHMTADADGNRRIDAADAVYILQIICGRRSCRLHE